MFRSIVLFLLLCGGASSAYAGQQWLSALANDDVRQLSRLVTNENDVNVGDKANRTALMIAAKYGHEKLFDKLILKGADPKARTNRGGTVLMYAVLGKNNAIVKRVIDIGVEVDATADNGWSALTIAAAKGLSDIVSILIPHSSDINLPDIYGWTPLMRAVDNRHPETVALLLESGRVKINAVNEVGESALHRAAEVGDEVLLSLLLSNQVDQSVLDKRGRSARDILQENGHTSLMGLL